jgi:hypothetical protein
VSPSSPDEPGRVRASGWLASGYARARASIGRSIASTRRGELGVVLLGVVLSPDHLIVSRVAGGWRQPSEQKEVIALAPPAPDAPQWQPAVEALAAKVLAGELSGGDVTLVLSNHFVHYVLVPWSDLLRSEEDQLAFARERFVRVHGGAAENWLIRLSQANPREPRLACGVDKALIDAVDAVMAPVASRFSSLQPYLMASFNRLRTRLGMAWGWFAVAEPGLLCLALLGDGQWQSFRTIGLSPDWTNDLSRALAREPYLVDSQTETDRVVVFAPDLPPGPAPEASQWKFENLQV